MILEKPSVLRLLKPEAHPVGDGRDTVDITVECRYRVVTYMSCVREGGLYHLQRSPLCLDPCQVPGNISLSPKKLKAA